MKAKLVCYTLGSISSTLRNKFKRELLGYKDYSNRGKYSYQRGGFLSEIPYYRPIRSVIVVRLQDENKIISFLTKYKAKYNIFDVTIESSLFKT